MTVGTAHLAKEGHAHGFREAPPAATGARVEHLRRGHQALREELQSQAIHKRGAAAAHRLPAALHQHQATEEHNLEANNGRADASVPCF